MFKRPTIKNILFATDLSQTAEHAFGYAVGMSVAYGARITVLHIIEKMAPNAELLLTTILGYGSIDAFRRNSANGLTARIKAHIEQFCARAADEVPECPFILHNIVVEPGKAVERILHHAGTGAYDVLVIGNRGLGIVTETLMGGTSRKVSLHSPIPVWVIPAERIDPKTHG